MRVVLDTNILVSGLISRTGPPAQILNAVRAGQIVAVMSEATLAELEDVLHRPAVQRYFTHAEITPESFLADLRIHILLPLKLRPPSRHGPERTEEVARWQQMQANRLNGGRPNGAWRWS